MSLLDKLKDLLGQKAALPASPPPLPAQDAAKPYTGPAPPPIFHNDAADEKRLEENRLKLREKIEQDYIRGTLRIMRGFEDHSLETVGEGCEVLFRAHQTSDQFSLGYLEPWKLVHAVSCRVLEGEALEKHLFLYRIASQGKREMMEFMERIATYGPDDYINEAFQRVNDSVAAASKNSCEATSAKIEGQPGDKKLTPEKVRELFAAQCVLEAQSEGRDLEEIIVEHKNQAINLCNDAWRHLEQGDYDAAYRGFLEAFGCDPVLMMPHVGAAKALSFLGRIEGSVQHAEMALAFAPEDQDARQTAFDTFGWQARKLTEQEDWIGAVGWHRKAILACPEDPNATAYFNIMYNTWDEKPGCFEPVLNACREIVARCPVWNYARYRLGRILFDSNHNEEAMPILREAVQREPTNSEYREWLCLALVAVGQGNAAWAEFQTMKESDPARAESFKGMLRKCAFEVYQELQRTDPARAQKFNNELGAGLFDPAGGHNN